jgi:hypothetical protein
MIPQRQRLPAIESNEFELLVHGQAVYLPFWDRAGRSSILSFTCVRGGEGARFSYSPDGFADTICCFAVRG